MGRISPWFEWFLEFSTPTNPGLYLVVAEVAGGWWRWGVFTVGRIFPRFEWLSSPWFIVLSFSPLPIDV